MAETKEVKGKKSKVESKATKKAAKPVANAEKVVKDGIIQENSNAPVETNIENTKEITLAKAGKRSEKALKEAEEKTAKEERKAAVKESEKEEKPKPKQVQKVRSILERRSKGFRKSAQQIEAGKVYSLKDALNLATKTSHVKFDATVELHVRLGIDPRQADQNLRDTIVLPSGSGKSIRVAVFADAEQLAAAKKAGADAALAEEFLQQLEKGVVDFDILITTPQQMAKLGKYARLLGPKGLMPNPKSGTVTTDIAKAVTGAKAGRLEYRVDSTGIVHVGVGKVSFGGEKLFLNGRALLESIKSNKPASLKGTYVKSIFVTTSMGPSISVEISEI